MAVVGSTRATVVPAATVVVTRRMSVFNDSSFTIVTVDKEQNHL